MATYVVLTTHHRYEKARNCAIESLEKSRWPKSSTVILHSDRSDVPPGSLPILESLGTQETQESPESPETQESPESPEIRKFERVYKTHANLYEYAGFFVPLVVATSDDDAFFMFHDTCLAHGDFSEKIVKAADEWRSKKLDILWGSPNGQCNLCIFGRKAAQKAWDMWSTWATLDKMKSVHMEHPTNHPESLKSLKELKQEYSKVGQIKGGVENPYGGAKRHKLIFPFFDVTKYYVHIGRSEDHPQAP